MIENAVCKGDIHKDIFPELENACRRKDNDCINAYLASAGSDCEMRNALERVIECYIQEGLFPVGYVIFFVKWLIGKNDLETAMRYINESLNRGVDNGRISQTVYECLIRPDEDMFRSRFNRNLHVLRENGIFIPVVELDFDEVKKEIALIHVPGENGTEKLECFKGRNAFCANAAKTGLIREILKQSRTLFVAYNNIASLYYLLLFEDIGEIEEEIEKRRVLFFTGDIVSELEEFFENVLVLPPDNYLNLPLQNEYKTAIDEFIKRRAVKSSNRVKDLMSYYGDMTPEYYRALFLKDPSEAKIMLITSRETELNRHLTVNWMRGFIKMGYRVKLLIEKEPYETMNNGAVYEAMHEYRPDIVFHINHSADIVFEQDAIRGNLLWIMRYRDIIHGMDARVCKNMFVLPMVQEWSEELHVRGVPENRTMYTPEGVDLSIFVKRNNTDDRYRSDIVSVNNSGGDEFYRYSFLLERYNNKEIKQIIRELYSDIGEMCRQERFVFFDRSFKKLLEKKLLQRGLQLSRDKRDVIIRFLTLIVFSFYRRRVVEWIIESGITGSIKVWGRGWDNYDKFRNYHMGIARHGRELAAIYGGSRISISDHPNIPIHERTFEIFASGGFPVVKNIEPENGENIDYLTEYFREGEEVVMFYDKNDLLDKIQYYLDHPGERDEIAGKGREIVVRKFSSDAIAKKTMDHIKTCFAGQKI